MSRDRLFLLPPQFEDRRFPERRFFCPYSAQIGWLLSAFPSSAKAVDVHYVGFERPREAVVALVGEDHQSLPLLVLGDDSSIAVEAESRDGVRFLSGPRLILAALAARHGFPEPHP